MIFTFYKARGMSVGSSLVEDDKLELAKSLEELAKKKGVEFILPTDIVAADKFDENAKTQVVAAGDIPDGWMVSDGQCSRFKLIHERQDPGCGYWQEQISAKRVHVPDTFGPFACCTHKAARHAFVPERCAFCRGQTCGPCGLACRIGPAQLCF